MDSRGPSTQGSYNTTPVLVPTMTLVTSGSPSKSPPSSAGGLKSQLHLLNTLGVDGSKCGFLATGNTGQPLKQTQRSPHTASHNTLGTYLPHTNSITNTAAGSSDLGSIESEYCFVDACDNSLDVESLASSTAAGTSGGCVKTNFVSKLFGAFRNMNQGSTTWVNPSYLSSPVMKSVQRDQHCAKSPLFHQKTEFPLNKSDLMQPQLVPETSMDCYASPHNSSDEEGICSGSGARTFNPFGDYAHQGYWQNKDVLNSRSEAFLFHNMSRDQFLHQQQQQYLYYQNLQDKKLRATYSGSNYGSDLDDSWNVVTTGDCLESTHNNNYINSNCSVNGNTAPQGVINGLVQFTLPAITCVNVTVASQLYTAAFGERAPDASYSAFCSPENSGYSAGNVDCSNFSAITNEFSFSEAAELPVNEGYIACQNIYPSFSLPVPEILKMSVPVDPRADLALDVAALNQINKMPHVASSLNPDAKEWNGWVSHSKLNPEAKEWVPAAPETVQNGVISSCLSENACEESMKSEGEQKNDTGLILDLKTDNAGSEFSKSNVTFSEDMAQCALLGTCGSPNSVGLHSFGDEPSSSIIDRKTTHHNSSICAAEAPNEESVNEELPSEHRTSSESSTTSWDEVDACHARRLTESELPATLVLPDDVMPSATSDAFESDSSDMTLYSTQDEILSEIASTSLNSDQSENVTGGARPKKSSCFLLEKLKNFSFSPCKRMSSFVEQDSRSSNDETDDVCEFVIFAEDDDDDEDCDNPNDTDDYEDCSEDSDDESEKDDTSIASDESFDEYCDANDSDDGSIQFQSSPPVRGAPETDGCSRPQFKCISFSTSLCAIWQSQKHSPEASVNFSDDDWDWHAESTSGSISDGGWAFEQGLMTIKTPINTLSKRLGYVEKERKKSLTDVEKANLKWDTEIDNNVLGNSGQKVQFSDDVSYGYVDKDIERKGEWEQIARDNLRFRNRISNLCKILSPILDENYRKWIYHARYQQHSHDEDINATFRL